MDLATSLDAGPLPAAAPPRANRWRISPRQAIAVGVAAMAAGATYVRLGAPYTAGSPLGYNLGLVGGALMLLLLPYALRKRLRCLRQCGTMRGWFLFHIAAGLLGPLLVVFHSTFRIGSLNGGVALASTLLVTASGLVGRFFYRKVHRGLSGCRANQEELQATLDRQLEAVQPQWGGLPAVAAETRRYLTLAASPPAARARRLTHFLLLGGQRQLAGRRIRQSLRAADTAMDTGSRTEAFGRLWQTIDAALLAAQRTAQFAIYERLFSLWHTVHLPFLYLLVLTAAVHVVAVHAY